MAITNPARRGDDYYLYLNTGTFASPTWDLVGFERSVEPEEDGDSQEVAYRRSRFKRVRHGKKSIALKVTMDDRKTDSDRDAFDTSYRSEAEIGLALADGPIATNGTIYLKGEWLVTKKSKPENNGSINEITYELGLADTTNEPTFVTVSA